MITLPGGRQTTRLGFGTAGLHGGTFAKQQSLRLLACAYEAGLRHFDCAPLYGLGYAESVVGAFLARHPDATITTKFGLPPPKHASIWNAARIVARPVANRIPGLKRFLLGTLSRRTEPSQAAHVAGPPSARARYGALLMQLSLEESLRKLQRDHIDIFLFHDAEECDLTDEVLSALDRCKRSGKIGAWGMGGAGVRGVGVGRLPQLPVLQYEWSPLQPTAPLPGTLNIVFGVLSRSLAQISSLLPEQRLAFARAHGLDPGDPGAVARWCVKSALVANDQGIVLFTTRSSARIQLVASLQH